MIPIPEQVKPLIAYVVSLDIVLAAVSLWLQSFGNTASNLISLLVAIAGLLISVLTGLKIYENWKIAKLDRRLKELEVKEKEEQSSKSNLIT